MEIIKELPREYTIEERAALIVEACMQEQSTDPVEIFRHIAAKDFIRMHGPEHHVLDGACIMTAFHNAGGSVNLQEGLQRIVTEGLRMPGATCGLWGVCGSVTSIGAALAFIDGTGPLSADGSWGMHMRFTSQALQRLAEIGGPRCCKRDAFVAMTTAIAFLQEHYGITLASSPIRCEFYPQNRQCIHERCPFRGV